MEPLEFISKLSSTSIKDDKERYWRTTVNCFLVDRLEQIQLCALPKYFTQYYSRSPEYNGKLSTLLQEPEFKFICVPKIIATAIWLQPSDFLKHFLSNLINTDNKMINSVNNNNLSHERVGGLNPFAIDAQQEMQGSDQNDETRFGRLTLEEFSCGICFELLKDAVEGNCCKNIFCSLCIEQNGKKCPNCRRVVEWTANEPIRRLIGKKPVQCEYVECRAWSTVSEIEQHQDKCEFNPVNMLVSCQKCQQQIMRRLIEEHLSNVCEMVEVLCLSCDALIVRKNLAYHEEQVCEYQRMLCAHGCGEHMIYKEYMATHYDRCTHQLIKCTNQNCNVRLQRRRIPAHLKDCKHSVIECENNIRGCDAKYIRAQNAALQKHTELCRYRIVKCPHGCDKEMQKRKVKSHFCDYRPMDCVYCTKAFPKKDLVGHGKTCPSRMVECNLCKESVTYGSMHQHKSNQCPERIVLCDTCQGRFTARSISQHEEFVCAKRLINCQYCNKAIKADQVEQHEEKCLERKIKCAKCNERVQASLMSHHESDICKHRLVNCDECSQSVEFRSLARHNSDECPERSSVCEDCDEEMPARVMYYHRSEECRNRFVICYICRDVFNSCDMGSHEAQCRRRKRCSQCGKTGPARSLEYHQLIYCEYRKLVCPKCDEVVYVKDCNEHMEKCPEREVCCKNCQEWVPFYSFDSHQCPPGILGNLFDLFCLPLFLCLVSYLLKSPYFSFI